MGSKVGAVPIATIALRADWIKQSARWRAGSACKRDAVVSLPALMSQSAWYRCRSCLAVLALLVSALGGRAAAGLLVNESTVGDDGFAWHAVDEAGLSSKLADHHDPLDIPEWQLQGALSLHLVGEVMRTPIGSEFCPRLLLGSARGPRAPC